jgi:hypothetical protein
MDKKDFNILGLKINTGSSKKDIAYVTGYNSYVQKIEHICKTQKGEIPYSRSLGIEYYDLKFNSVVGKNVMQLKIQNNIKNFVKEFDSVVAKTQYTTNDFLILDVYFELKKQLNTQKLK